MNGVETATRSEIALTNFKASTADVARARVTGAVPPDALAEVVYEDGNFTIQMWSLTGPAGEERELQPAEATALIESLRRQLMEDAAGVDKAALAAFTDLLSGFVEAQASNRFDNVRFGDISQDEAMGIIWWHVALGVDVAGTIHDQRHKVTYEQHVVPLAPGKYAHLSKPDRLSLARAISRFIDDANRQLRPINKLWLVVLEDVER